MPRAGPEMATGALAERASGLPYSSWCLGGFLADPGQRLAGSFFLDNLTFAQDATIGGLELPGYVVALSVVPGGPQSPLSPHPLGIAPVERVHSGRGPSPPLDRLVATSGSGRSSYHLLCSEKLTRIGPDRRGIPALDGSGADDAPLPGG